jgi:hypothetical protein
MIIDCISSLKGDFSYDLPGGDLLILAGNYLGEDGEWQDFFDWVKKQKYRKKIAIAGYEDDYLLNTIYEKEKDGDYLVDDDGWVEVDFEYLNNSGTEFEGLKIWGLPWCMDTCWHNFSKYYMPEKYCRIPNDIDILITENPPFGILDVNSEGNHYGNIHLRDFVTTNRLTNLMLHVFGYFNFGGGVVKEERKYVSNKITTFINCNCVNPDGSCSNFRRFIYEKPKEEEIPDLKVIK